MDQVLGELRGKYFEDVDERVEPVNHNQVKVERFKYLPLEISKFSFPLGYDEENEELLMEDEREL